VPRDLLLLLLLLACGRAVSSVAPPCVVSRVVDGDTFYCRDGRKVRLIGVDSPELAQGDPGRAARDALGRLLPQGSAVRLEEDATHTDRYGRVLAWVWSDAGLVNEALVRGGWAVLYTVPPNVKYASRVERAQKQAREARAGLWSGSAFECPPSEYRRHACPAGR
jgi:micrococcal nuclease